MRGALALNLASAESSGYALDMQQIGLPERRKTSRVPMFLRVDDRTGAVRAVRMGTDLSLDGMRLETTRRYRAGDELDLELRLRDKPEPLRVRASVVSVGDGEVSVRFDDLSTAGRVRITECMFGDL